MTLQRLSSRTLETLLGDWQSDSTTPTYAALADRIRLLIIDGRIVGGTGLPAERELSQRLSLSRTTISAAYQHLRKAGYLSSRQGSGSVVGLPDAGVVTDAPPRDESLINMQQACPAAWPGIPELITTTAEASVSLIAHHGYEIVGLPRLREAIAGHYTERGLPTEPEQIMVTTGAQHAISLIARTLLSRGDRAMVELPTYPHAYGALRDAGARLSGVAVTEQGWDEEGLLTSLHRVTPTLAYLIPDFHNPTGQSMTPQFRQQLVAAAADSGTTLIADETTGLLNIDRVGEYLPLAAYASSPSDPSGTNVITIGSLSKSVWGGLRIGWIRADLSLIRRLSAARSNSDLGTPNFEQTVASLAFEHSDEIAHYRGQQLGAQRDLLIAELRRRLPEWQVPSAPGGVALWVNLGKPLSSSLVLAARMRGLLLSAGPLFGINGAYERFLRIPFTDPPEQIARAVEILADAWHSVLATSTADDAALHAEHAAGVV